MSLSNTGLLSTRVSQVGYAIQDWATVQSIFEAAGVPPCGPDLRPAWAGVFDKPVVFGDGNPGWYFTGQSFATVAAISADRAPDYPLGDWINNDNYFVLGYGTGMSGTRWFLGLNDVCNNSYWLGFGPATKADASGTYTWSGGDFGNQPPTIQVVKLG
jgi:hypothetical protein